MTESKDGGSRKNSLSSDTDTLNTFSIPKTRSTGDLLDHLAKSESAPGRSSSFDQDAGGQPLKRTRSKILHDHDLQNPPSGLHRIRQQLPQRRSSPGLPVRSTSMTTPRSSAGDATFSIPISPVTSTSEDLMRFPSESLHSFSFAPQSSDLLQTRNNVLKRAIDLLKEKGMFADGGLSTATAQAKLNGDQEVQGMIELLDKAQLLGSDSLRANSLGIMSAPRTGPAHVTNENIFEQSFAQSESPETVDSPSEDLATPIAGDPRQPTPSLTIDIPDEPPRYSEDEPVTAPTMGSRPRATLKRSYTDVAPLTLQHQLTDALSKPYFADDAALLTPSASASLTRDTNTNSSPFPGFTPHAHGRNMPLSQAIFTTEAQSPFTVSASNDLACLAFGVQQSEIRKLSILDVIREDKRNWLERKLAGARQGSTSTPKSMPSSPRTSVMGGGLTARLLSKAPSRETGQGKRNKSAATSPTSMTPDRYDSPKPLAELPQSNGVLLCGDVIPIQKRNGDVGSASVWVQEKRDKLIWVMEEIVEDTAFLSVDEIGCVTKASGRSEAIWGMEHVRRGMDVTRMIPDMPRLKGTNTGALDYDRIADLRRFTARTANDISVPITVDQLSGQQTFRISSFPHMAGMMIVSASTLKVSSSNIVVSEALFGQRTTGMAMNQLIPGFDSMLELLVEDDDIDLIEGIVIPEHSFRRARAMLALREGKADAAAIFLRPNGVPAVHRDGAQIMVDIQMRVVKSEAYSQAFSEPAINEGSCTAGTNDVAYAVWVNYSKMLHAVHHGIGPVSPLVSRPSTPPHQPVPGQAILVHEDSESDGGSRPSSAGSSGFKLGSAALATNRELNQSSSGTSPTANAISPPKDSGQYRKSMSINDFIILEDMGAGAYGQVKLARPKTSAPEFLRAYSKIVIKYVTKRRILVDTWTRDRKLGTVPLEVHVLDYLRRDGLQHPNIVEMIDFFEDDVNYYILMKPHGLPGMDLFDYIELRVQMDEDECRRLFAQVASAVLFLHTKAKVVHRDIKDENVVLDGEGRIKLIDFGSASYIRNGPFDVFVGTIDYAAPEVLSGSFYDGLKQDIWALGILLYTIVYKENPFYSIDEILDHDLRVPFIVSEENIDLIRRMLDRDVEKRPSITEVCNHPWLQKSN